MYQDIHIDQKTLSEWKKIYISFKLETSLAHISKFDHHEKKNYVVDIKNNNFENELQAFAFNDNQFQNIDFVFCDINENWQEIILFILNELHNILTNFYAAEWFVVQTEPVGLVLSVIPVSVWVSRPWNQTEVVWFGPGFAGSDPVN